MKLTIADHAGSVTKTVTVKVSNADYLLTPEAGHQVVLSSSLGDCPAGTVPVGTISMPTVAGGASATATLTVTANSSFFRAGNTKSPGRCTAVLTATTNVPANTEPDATNNSTHLVIDVVDKNDF